MVAPTDYLYVSSILSPLKGNSPVRGNVCIADKRVPVSGGKDVKIA